MASLTDSSIYEPEDTLTGTISLPDFIVDLDDYTESINMMVYADPGSGKTVLAGTARTLIIATEQGTVAAARQGAAKNGAKVVNCVNDWERFEDTYDWLETAAGEPGFPFDWIAIDTGTTMQDLIRQDIVSTAAELDPTRNRDKTELQEWGEAQERFKRYVGLLNDLPVNTLWLAHAMLAEDEEGNQFQMPKFQGKGNQIAMWTAAQMHCYGFLHPVPVKSKATGRIRIERRIQWDATAKIRAKDRFDVLGGERGFTKDLSLAELTDLIEKEAGEEPAPPAKKAPAKKAPAKKAAPAMVAAGEKEGNQ